MCAINGFNFKDEGLAIRMNTATKHRGPDGTRTLVMSGATFGFNRLAIIDLDARAMQPMQSVDQRYTIVFNGEIYNYRELKQELSGYPWKTESDTEVILAAVTRWGVGAFKRLNGMFALALWDELEQCLVIARDHVGVKPLYYYHKDGKFIFSSEVKGILAYTTVARSLNTDALNMYFRMLYIPSPYTMWTDIYKLKPGHYAVVKGDALTIEEYWRIEDAPVIEDKEHLKSEISRLLHDSVQRQTISDRPVGVFLSGGVDSTIITGIMSKLSGKVKTFSVGFEETAQSEKYNADAVLAKQTAQHFGTEHHEYILSASDVGKNLERAVCHMDEPISNHIQAVNMLLAEAVSKEATVVLGGDGGDELFGGYERHYYNRLLDVIQRTPHPFRHNSVAEYVFKIVGKSSAYEKLNLEPGVGRYLSFFAQKEDMVRALLKPELNNAHITNATFEKLYFSSVSKSDFTRQSMRADVRSWLPDESLVRSDKMSMAASIEARVPFLDYRLVELADRIPTRFKIGKRDGRGYRGKVILKEAMEEYLPQHVLEQPKWGWFSPAAKWVRNDLNAYVREVLSPSYCKGTAKIFDFDAINRIFNDHVSGKKYALNTIWSVLTFQLWYRQFMVD